MSKMLDSIPAHASAVYQWLDRQRQKIHLPTLMAYLSLLLHGLYLLSWHVFQCGKEVYRTLAGTSAIPLKEARIQRIVYRRKRDAEEISRREDFVTLDDGFESKEILKAPEWTVYSLDKNGVIFVELPKPLSHYSIDKHPFVFTPIFEEALRVAEIDLESYVSLGDQLETDYKPPSCLFLTNTARCAGTLFGSMLQHEGRSTVIAEHHALTILSLGLKEGYFSQNDISRLLSATIKVIRKGIPTNQLMVFKTTCSEVNLVPFLTADFPEIKHMFMFRRRGVSSVEKMLARDPSYLVLLRLYNIAPALATFFGFLAAVEGPLQRQFKPSNIKEWAMLVYAGPYLVYKQNKDSFDFPIVWHDELITSPEKVLSPIFEQLNIPEECLLSAIGRMERDSQAGTFLSREKLQDVEISPLTPELKATLERYAAKMQMESDVLGLADA